MTSKLASRIAGLKLSGIVAVLLIPMLVLSYFMVRSLRHDIGFAERELDGVAFNRIVQPIMLGAARNDVRDEDILRLRTEGVEIGRRLGFERDLTGALATFHTSSDKRYALPTLKKLLAQAATKSNIILDPYAETYYLGAISSLHAPGLLSDFADAWTSHSRAMRDHALDAVETTNLLLALGSWRESQERLQDSYQYATDASSQLGGYAKGNQHVSEMSMHPLNVARLFSGAMPKELTGKLAVVPEFTHGAEHFVIDIAEVWNISLARFDELLRRRLSTMNFQLISTLSTGIAVCLIGVAAAAMMFRTTLRELDTVQLARDQAERARNDTLGSAAELQKVSDDVVRLNLDLSENLNRLKDAQDDSLRKGKLAQLGQLTATVAHELRNPLGAVRTSTFLLERKLKGKGLGVEQQLDRINNGVTRCDGIISQLLDFARSRSLQAETVSLDDWLSRLVEDEAQRLPAAIVVECRLGLADLQVSIDPGLMSRVLINLISNASEAMVGKGDDPAKFSVSQPRIEIETRLAQRGIEIIVADNGPGIAVENLQKIFEPLFTTKNFGTGLGLPAVEKILEQHGGGLEVRTALGQGAVFTAWWPHQAKLKEAV
jgi:signal transduction histidine kinase